MSSIASAQNTRRRRLAAVARGVLHLTRKAAIALQVHVERRHLMRLDHAALKDMGFNKGQAENEATRPFWDIPVDRLR